MKALVTGGAGFIGSHLVDALLKMGHGVICFDNFDPYYDVKTKRQNIAHNLSNKNFRLIEADIRNDAIKKVMRENDVEYIFHEAAQPGVRASIENPIKAHEVNVTGTLNVLGAALDSGVKKIINASSSSVYGRVEHLPFDERHPTNPLSPYGVSKLAAEHYCRVFQELYGLRIVSLRYFTVFGPRMRPDLAISIFTKKALRDEPIAIFGDGTKTRDFTYADDAINATIAAMNRGDGVYNIGGGNVISIDGLARKIIEKTKSRSRIICKEPVKGDAEHTYADINKARKELGWTPRINLDEGLENFIRWLAPS